MASWAICSSSRCCRLIGRKSLSWPAAERARVYLLRQMERANETGCREDMALYRAHHRIEGQTLVPDLRSIDGIEQEEVVMGLPCSRRTRSPVASRAETGCSFGEGIIPFQFAYTSRNIVNNPMVESTRYWGIIV